MNKPRLFDLGQIVATPGVVQAFDLLKIDPTPYIIRHMTGDWGTVDLRDAYANDRAIKDGDRILSAYIHRTYGETPDKFTDTKFWIITEADRSATTILLPDEY